MSQSESLHVLYVVTDQVAERYAPLLRHLCIAMIDEAISTTVVVATSKMEGLFVGPVAVLHHKSGLRLFPGRSLQALVERVPSTPHVVHCLASDGARLAVRLAEHWKADLVLQIASIDDGATYRSIRFADIGAMPAFTAPLAERLAGDLQDKASLIQVIRPGTYALKVPPCFTVPDRLPTLLVRCPLVGDCGVDDVLQAVARLIQEQTPVLLFILGSGPKESSYRRRAEVLKIGGQVTFAGQVREWTRVVEGADILIQPRASTVFDIHALEAMAAGTAVVACSAGIEDYFHDEQTVLLASAPSPEGFYQCLRRLLDHPEFARTLGENAQKYIQTHHAATSMTSACVQLYRTRALKHRTFPMRPNTPGT